MGIVHPCNRLRTYSLLCMRRSLLQQVGVYQILLTLLLTSLLQLVVSCFIIVLLGPRKKKKTVTCKKSRLAQVGVLLNHSLQHLEECFRSPENNFLPIPHDNSVKF